VLEHPAKKRPLVLAFSDREGYLKGIAIFDTQQAEANRRYFDALLARILATGGDSYSIKPCPGPLVTA